MSNIYKVINEEHLNEILENNLNTPVVALYTSKLNDSNMNLKKFLKYTSSKIKDFMFLYIDVDNYINNTTIHVKSLPTTYIFLNKRSLCVISGKNTAKITEGINYVHSRILAAKEQQNFIQPEEKITVHTTNSTQKKPNDVSKVIENLSLLKKKKEEIEHTNNH